MMTQQVQLSAAAITILRGLVKNSVYFSVNPSTAELPEAANELISHCFAMRMPVPGTFDLQYLELLPDGKKWLEGYDDFTVAKDTISPGGDTPKPSYMDDMEFEGWKRGDTVQYMGYTVQQKRDFGPSGYRVGEEQVHAGWIVTKNRCLATPGGVWAKTKDEAIRLICALVISDGDADKFHALCRLTKK